MYVINVLWREREYYDLEIWVFGFLYIFFEVFCFSFRESGSGGGVCRSSFFGRSFVHFVVVVGVYVF